MAFVSGLSLGAGVVGAKRSGWCGVSQGPVRAGARRAAANVLSMQGTEYEVPVTRRLSDALKEADVEQKKADEAARKREEEDQRKRFERQRKIEQLASIPDNTPIGTVDEYMFREGVADVLDKLDHDLIGLVPVKKRVREIAALLIVDKMRHKLGLETAVPSLHMSFTGAPGTGKTTVAMRMGQILQRMGYSKRGHLVIATRDDLVGQYVGHTAPKTKEMIKKAMGGVLLVDEAYYLYNASNDRDYGQEAIEILLNVMETEQKNLVCIYAGYSDKMERFFSYIPGMNSRIGNHIEFPNYEVDELVDIARVMVRELEYQFDENSIPIMREYIQKRMNMPYFSNARSVRNTVDRARMRAAIRLFNQAVDGHGDGMVSAHDLMTITAQDVVRADELSETQISE
ncbi:Protein cbbX-like, chloroplastic [Porphyridium purpureum]|uniref:Protein cbbX-like, chloroplastic n=1 Tax=Porphyridium purpureum TaxID=35688 RepID=A0A5J4YXV5_PORPP|nr:Protein cbbX-like, chloroplastic [Porphyridium purpureum]|eukprot:POR5301..scf209_3